MADVWKAYGSLASPKHQTQPVSDPDFTHIGLIYERMDYGHQGIVRIKVVFVEEHLQD